MSLKKIYIEKRLAQSQLVENIQQRNDSRLPIIWLDDVRDLLHESIQLGRRDAEKNELLIYSFPGRFLSSCPGTDGMICCNYYVINTGVGCPFDCHYCYLNGYTNLPLMTLHGNLDELFSEISKLFVGKKGHYRIGTGEYSDSLALEELTGYSARLVEWFARHDNLTLELKSKAKLPDELLELAHRGRTVLAWSLNPQKIIDEIEPGTASLSERLESAAMAQKAGYRLAFHFDPIIHFEGWEMGYHEVIESLFDAIRPENVAWISLGAFRCNSQLKNQIRTIFPEEGLTRAEMVQASDGKYRYFKTIREEIYNSIERKIKEIAPELFSYLCMESRPMWNKIYNLVPDSAKNLDEHFEKRRQTMERGCNATTSV